MPMTGVLDHSSVDIVDDQRWLVNRMGDCVLSVALDLKAFASSTYANRIFANLNDDTTDTYIVSGVPLVQDATSHKYRPVKDNGDVIAGFLDRPIPVTFTRKGLKSDAATAPMRYAAVINPAYIPCPMEGNSFNGLILKLEDNQVRLASTPGQNQHHARVDLSGGGPSSSVMPTVTTASTSSSSK